MSRVEFRIGKLKIGEINGLPLDNKVFVPDLLGIERSESLQNDDVIALAKLLQSIDEDGNITNGIKIPEYVKDNIADYETVFNKDNLYDYLKRVSTPLDAIPSTLEVQEHLRESFRTNRVDIGQGDMGQGGVGLNKGNQSEGSFDINEYATTENLSQPLKDAIAYMGNEERLAYDVYMNLYDRYKDTLEETALYPLYSIAHKSESKHISTVQSIVQRYSITPDQLTNITTGVANSDATVETMPSGKYGIKAIQDLYNSLYAKGSKSARDALEVGCMVEVTDINDLNKYIELAQEDEAEDVKLAFENLRNGSYNHYWAFDTALKNIGVDDGCCVVGYSFCKTEDDYPKNSLKQI